MNADDIYWELITKQVCLQPKKDGGENAISGGLSYTGLEGLDWQAKYK